MPLTVALYGGVLLILYTVLNKSIIESYYIDLRFQSGFFLILIGFIWYLFNKLSQKIDGVTKDLENINKYGIQNIIASKNNSLRDIIKDIENKRFIYKLSVFLSNPESDDIFYLKDLIFSNTIDSKIRILIGLDYDNKNINQIENQIDELLTIGNKRIEIRKTKQIPMFSCLIFDTNIWIINKNNSKEISNNIHLKLDTNSHIGEEYIWFFNNSWDTSDTIT
jgi:hypothetical protein